MLKKEIISPSRNQIALPASTLCLIFAMAFPGLSPFGHTFVQFMMVRHR